MKRQPRRAAPLPSGFYLTSVFWHLILAICFLSSDKSPYFSFSTCDKWLIKANAFSTVFSLSGLTGQHVAGESRLLASGVQYWYRF